MMVLLYFIAIMLIYPLHISTVPWPVPLPGQSPVYSMWYIKSVYSIIVVDLSLPYIYQFAVMVKLPVIPWGLSVRYCCDVCHLV